MTVSFRTPVTDPPFSDRWAFGAIVGVSAGAIAFLLWLLYLHHPPPTSAGQWVFLPQLNALLNGLSAVAVCVGLYFIKQRNWRAHRASMIAAFGFSLLFLVSYIVNHALHGDTVFPGTGGARQIYLGLLASHILTSVVAQPLILTTFYLALRGDFVMHRRVARFTFPLWLYVSITGVVVFVFLFAYAY